MSHDIHSSSVHLLSEDGDRCGHEDVAVVRRILDKEFLDSDLIRSHLSLILLRARITILMGWRQKMHKIVFSISESWRQ